MSINAGKLVVEHATINDLPEIVRILNHYILKDHCIFDTQPWTVAEKASWFEQFQTTGPHQLLVARRNDDVIAYAYSARWRPKAAYDVTAESTVYVRHDAHGSGVGRLMMESLLKNLHGQGLHHLVAGIALPNDASIGLHEQLGYRPVGTFHGVGYKFGKSWDVRWYEYDFEAALT
jgi:phosphinothricin acetyltransferase